MSRDDDRDGVCEGQQHASADLHRLQRDGQVPGQRGDLDRDAVDPEGIRRDRKHQQR